MSQNDSNHHRSLFSDLNKGFRSIWSAIVEEWREFKSEWNDSDQWNAAVRKETAAIADFYLGPEQREQLKKMKPVRRNLYRAGWVLTAMFEKLSHGRRIILIMGGLFILMSRQDNSFDIVGGIFLLLVIMLELKDKLLAHDELEEGRHIQEMLMPERTPAVNGWSVWLYTRSANEVCGDLIDCIRMENGRFGLAIADVAGKGLHAALLTTKLQATIRAFAFDQRSLPDFIGRVNTIFHRDSPSHLFASLFYIDCDEASGRVSYVNAGHLPAMVMKNGSIRETEKGDLALGLTRTAPYVEHTIDLDTGDLFLLFSDGLTEAKNERGEFFGKERLMQILRSETGPSEQIGMSILRDIDRFTGTQKLSDDLSLIILKRTDR